MKTSVEKALNLDQYYTQPHIAENCMKRLKVILGASELFNDSVFLEPSAGTGAFIEATKKIFGERKIKAFDIEPKHYLIEKKNFLEVDLKDYKNIVTIGNPPFGNRASLAVDFFNKAAECSSIIAFIVPVQFRKWSVQSKLDKNFMLLYEEILPTNSFVFNNKEFSARCCFQIWSKVHLDGYVDKRIKEKPKTTHPDFELYQYNNTPEARKYFDYPWDFCVPRQGYYDYNTRIRDKADCKINIQYIFFRIINPNAFKIFDLIDFEKLSQMNTTIPGFGKADVVLEYEKIEQQLNMKGRVAV